MVNLIAVTTVLLECGDGEVKYDLRREERGIDKSVGSFSRTWLVGEMRGGRGGGRGSCLIVVFLNNLRSPAVVQEVLLGQSRSIFLNTPRQHFSFLLLCFHND